MSQIALFHPSFGVTPGVEDAAARLRAAGHDVLIVDQYDGRVFTDYDEAGAFVDEVGFPALMARAVEAVADLADGFLAMGFSNGGGMATYVALQRPIGGVILCSGALPVEFLGAGAWPTGVPAQLHATVDDPRRPAGHVESVMRSVSSAGADAEFFQYPGKGHLFTDPSLADEYDAAATERLWPRVLTFCAEHGR
ncbi:MAG TPA: dienelactone hydrolase family protein [Marmoricola sp.]|nr:dienelactone hydrolase family protein [Marmoricola sp.]